MLKWKLAYFTQLNCRLPILTDWPKKCIQKALKKLFLHIFFAISAQKASKISISGPVFSLFDVILTDYKTDSFQNPALKMVIVALLFVPDLPGIDGVLIVLSCS